MKILNSYERVQKMNSMQAITIRQVRPEDLDAVTEVEAVCFPKAKQQTGHPLKRGSRLFRTAFLWQKRKEGSLVLLMGRW